MGLSAHSVIPVHVAVLSEVPAPGRHGVPGCVLRHILLLTFTVAVQFIDLFALMSWPIEQHWNILMRGLHTVPGVKTGPLLTKPIRAEPHITDPAVRPSADMLW